MAEIEQKETIFNPVEARGEDPEIDIKATEEALFNFDDDAPRQGGARRLSDALAEFAGNAAEAFGDGARHLDLSDRYND
jgi:hypothetical protein